MKFENFIKGIFDFGENLRKYFFKINFLHEKKIGFFYHQALLISFPTQLTRAPTDLSRRRKVRNTPKSLQNGPNVLFCTKSWDLEVHLQILTHES